MNSRSLGATRIFAWPSAEVAVMGGLAAVRILHRRQLARVPPQDRERVEAELVAEHDQLVGGLKRACALGVIDQVIEPSMTRSAIADALAAARPVSGAHANIPL